MTPISLPKTGLAKLSALRARERLFLVFWGAVRWLALTATLFLVAVLVDFNVDKDYDTPIWLRTSMTIVQIIAAAIAFYYWVFRPLVTGPSLIGMARRVETNIPEFDHRLITSIQLTQNDAQTSGMSQQLIRNVTTESEEIAGRHSIVNLADSRRLKWGLGLLAWPLGALAILLIAFGPGLLGILLQRQLFANVEIPRDVRLTVATKKNPWPAGDEVVVRYDVTSREGKLDKEMKGVVTYVGDETKKSQTCDLVWDDQTEFAPDRAIFKAKVPHSSIGFTYRARLGDGRTGGSDHVTFEPRPQVSIDKVSVQAPSYIPDRPVRVLAGKNIKADEGSRGKVRIVVQKPVIDANLKLYELNEQGKEVESENMPMTLLPPETISDKGRQVTVYPAESAFFDLRPRRNGRYVAYRVSARDENNFDSADNPRGSIEITQPPEPTVRLMEERFNRPGEEASADDFFLTGLPVPLGRSIRVEYYFRSKVGAREKGPGPGGTLLYPAYFVYRINDEADETSSAPRWTRLPLTEVPETDESGPYNVAEAHFANLDFQKRVLKDRIEFTAKLAMEPGGISRTEGGGIFDFETETLRKKGPDGTMIPLEAGDRIEFYIEVFDRDPTPGRPPGISQPRTKELQTAKVVIERTNSILESDQKIRDLQDKQQGVFKRPQP